MPTRFATTLNCQGRKQASSGGDHEWWLDYMASFSKKQERIAALGKVQKGFPLLGRSWKSLLLSSNHIGSQESTVQVKVNIDPVTGTCLTNDP